MRRTLSALVLSALFFASGCHPLLLAGGVVALKLANDAQLRAQSERRAAAQLEERLRRHREEEQRKLVELARRRAAENDRRHRAEMDRQRQTEQERRERIEAERRRLAELSRRRRQNTEIAGRLVADIEAKIKSGAWNASVLQKAVDKAKQADTNCVALPVRQRLHVGLGLLAWLADSPGIARSQFAKAKRLGCDNPRAVCPSMWTPGGLQTYTGAQGD